MLTTILVIFSLITAYLLYTSNDKTRLFGVAGIILGFVIGSSTGISSGGGAVNGSITFAVIFGIIGVLIGKVLKLSGKKF